MKTGRSEALSGLKAALDWRQAIALSHDGKTVYYVAMKGKPGPASLYSA